MPATTVHLPPTVTRTITPTAMEVTITPIRMGVRIITLGRGVRLILPRVADRRVNLPVHPPGRSEVFSVLEDGSDCSKREEWVLLWSHTDVC